MNNIADDLAQAYADGYKQGKKDAEKRTHGKWIKGSIGDCSCSVCGNYAEYDYDYVTNNGLGNDEFCFCSYCGADMRGK